jgi:uncharacterized membrane protein
MGNSIMVLEGILAVLFLIAGAFKTFQDKEKLAKRMPWVNDYTAAAVKFVGISEILGAVGLIVPHFTGILPVVSPIAAVALAVVMLLASVYHIRKKEYKEVVLTGILIALLAVVVFYHGMKYYYSF